MIFRDVLFLDKRYHFVLSIALFRDMKITTNGTAIVDASASGW